MPSEEHAKRRALQIRASYPVTEVAPTDPAATCYWIYALRRLHVRQYPRDRLTSGKWLLYPSTEQVDRFWAAIKEATEDGRLGNQSKVATARGAKPDINTGRMCHVICVYTYDWEDTDDMVRVREELRKLGITWRIPYKTDADTEAGKYACKGDRMIAKYWL